MTLLPAAAALVGEWIGPGESRRGRWQSVAWGLAAAVALTVLVFWWRSYALLAGVAGAGITLFVGVALAALAASLIACMAAPRRSATLFAAVLACGLLCLGMRFADERFGRFDPLPAWGERVRAACAQGCDGFVYGEEVTSLEFYSGFDWIPVLDPVRDIPERMKHARGVRRPEVEPGARAGRPAVRVGGPRALPVLRQLFDRPVHRPEEGIPDAALARADRAARGGRALVRAEAPRPRRRPRASATPPRRARWRRRGPRTRPAARPRRGTPRSGWRSARASRRATPPWPRRAAGRRRRARTRNRSARPRGR